MTRKLETLFDLPPSVDENNETPTIDETIDFCEHLQVLDETIDKVEAALPQVRGLDMADQELDELAKLAVDGYKELTDLGMQVDSRFAGDIFSVASNMLGHAIAAKTAKLDKKLKIIDLQLKKMKLDQAEPEAAPISQTGTGMVLNRNDLLARIIADNKQNSKKE